MGGRPIYFMGRYFAVYDLMQIISIMRMKDVERKVFVFGEHVEFLFAMGVVGYSCIEFLF